MGAIRESTRILPVVQDCDLCVIGGSCTGVFAAVRAARLGLRVVIIEKSNAFGGVATNGLVSIWHSQMDTAFRQQIIGGLTAGVMDRVNLNQTGEAAGTAAFLAIDGGGGVCDVNGSELRALLNSGGSCLL